MLTGNISSLLVVGECAYINVKQELVDELNSMSLRLH